MKLIQLSILVGLVSLTACRERTSESGANPVVTNTPVAASTNARTFLVRGVVKKVDPDGKTVSIQHEEIPNYMAAMTMPFKVKNTNDVNGLQPGEAIWFRLWVTDDESWIDKVTRDSGASTNAPPKPPEREAMRVARDVPVLAVGDLLPNYTLTNELGRTVNLADFKGQALAFTFIFTRCPMPEFCPRMSRNFQAVYKQLTTPNAPTNWHLLSISFDPHYDTPEVLRSYGQAFQYDPKRWSFVTGAMIDIDALTDHFELAIMKRGNDWDHKMRTVVVDPNGRIQKIVYGNEWTPESLAEEIVKAAAVPPNGTSPGPVQPENKTAAP